MRAKLKPSSVRLINKSPFHLLAAAMVITGIVGFGYAVTHVFAAGGASLYMVPASGSYNVGSQVAVQVMVNTGSDPANAVQADFSYPASRLQFVNIDGTGSAFDIDASSSGSNGTVSIARGKIGQVTGVALVATVHFTVQGTAGSAPLSFLGSSAIVRSTDNANVLGSTTGAAYTVTIPATPAPTPTPTPAPTHTPTPVPGATTPKSTTTPKTSGTPTPQKTATPTAAAGAPVSNSTPTPSTTAATPTPVTTAKTTQTGTNAKTLVSPAQFKTLLAGGSVLLIIIGVVLWLGVQRRHSLALVSAHGSAQPYPAPSVPAPAVTPPLSAPPVAPNQTFYPQKPSENQGGNSEIQQ